VNLPDLKLSVVIATYNRPKLLALLLEDLDRQTVDSDDFEVILVDDGSAIPAATVVEGRTHPYALSLIRQANTGQAAARHRGISQTRHELIVIVDDDMRLPETFLASHRRAHQRGFRVVLGLIKPAQTLAEMPIFERFHAHQLDKHVRAYRQGAEVPGAHLCTGNVSLRRSDYFEVGGFDTNLVRSEDRELGIRLEELGASFTFTEEAYSVHGSDHTKLDVWRRRAFLYGISDSRIGDKHRMLRHVSPWSYLFNMNPLARPLFLFATTLPRLGKNLTDAASAMAIWCDQRGFETMALRGATLVYGLEYYRGVREHSGSLLGAARSLARFLVTASARAG